MLKICTGKNLGAYTGEVSPEMLKSIGVQYVIIGHSERRAYFAERLMKLLIKIKICTKVGLKPIVCVGESLKRERTRYS